jgi:hypothetical protein
MSRTELEPGIPLELEVGAQLDVECGISSVAQADAEKIEIADNGATGGGSNFKVLDSGIADLQASAGFMVLHGVARKLGEMFP